MQWKIHKRDSEYLQEIQSDVYNDHVQVMQKQVEISKEHFGIVGSQFS